MERNRRYPGSRNLKYDIQQRDGNLCVYCGNPGQHADHVIPLDQGGKNISANFVWACHPCNVRKGNQIMFDWQIKAFFYLHECGEDLSWLITAGYDGIYRILYPELAITGLQVPN